MAREDRATHGDHHERLHKFAHDIRNKLAGIQEVLRSLPAATDPSEAATLTEFGERQYFKAMRDVEDLLDDMGVERGTPTLQSSPLELSAVVRAAVEAMGHRTTRKEQPVVLEVAEGIPVHGDERLLTELLSALVSNASKFSAHGRSIHIAARCSGDRALVSVRDEGVGLGPDDLGRVFDRYAWLDSRTTDGEAQGRSTLARLRQWALAHGGDLSAASAGTGQGCTFTLSLPLAAVS